MKNLQTIFETFIKKNSKKTIAIYLIAIALQALLIKAIDLNQATTNSYDCNQLIADYLLIGSLKVFFLSSILFIILEINDIGKTLVNLSYSISIFLLAYNLSFAVDLVQLYTTGTLQPDCQLLVYGFKWLFNPNGNHFFTLQWSDTIFFLCSFSLINTSFSKSGVNALHVVLGTITLAFLAKISFYIIAILEKEIVN